MTNCDKFASANPGWSHLVDPTRTEWSWKGSALWHRDALMSPYVPRPQSSLRRWVLQHAYATQNESKAVRSCLEQLVQALGATCWGLNLGAGSTRPHHRLINLDLFGSDEIDIVNVGQLLPFRDETLDLVISQEVLEHIARPMETISEVRRVLKAGGKFYCQVPFIIGFHPGPCDYWRFTKQGLEEVFSRGGWRIEKLERTLGSGSGFYRVAVEYVAVNSSLLGEPLYLPAKALASLMLLPFKLSDLWDGQLKQRDRIAGGYYCVVTKLD